MITLCSIFALYLGSRSALGWLGFRECVFGILFRLPCCLGYHGFDITQYPYGWESTYPNGWEKTHPYNEAKQ